jgi:trehalose 6-phosphate synthase
VDLVLVSHRVACPKRDEPIEGGLAAALLPAVRRSGAIWIGSSGQRSHTQQEPVAKVEPLGRGAVVRVDLPTECYAGFYEGFSNSALWPVLHSRTDLIRTDGDDFQAYRRINAFMAETLTRFVTPYTGLWVHDYHFLTLGAELRRLGIERPIGFFLHTPFPTRGVLHSLPHHRELVEAMLAYDLIGFQTDDDRRHFSDYLERELGLAVSGGIVFSRRGATRLGTFPIGIDVEAFADRAVKAMARADVLRLRSSLQGARLAIGVDRVDYSKGLANRFRAFDRLLQLHPDIKRTVSMLQIAVPSRGQIDAYRRLQRELAELVGEINGRHGEVDWMPIRYITKGFSQSTLAGFYRTARVGVVTPFHDGMNLVAKEYVAAQDPCDPGVLVLSEFAGAAKQLDAALLVNPHDIDALARAVATAFAMPLEERRERWNQMIAELRASSVNVWFAEFVAALEASRVEHGLGALEFDPLLMPRGIERAAVPTH